MSAPEKSPDEDLERRVRKVEERTVDRGELFSVLEGAFEEFNEQLASLSKRLDEIEKKD